MLLQVHPAHGTLLMRTRIALEAAYGMHYLHNQGVVHFDLKCDNLLCDVRNPSKPLVKIGDMGLSKQKQVQYVSGLARGTPQW
jgi:serine/threonine protein kinase